MSRPRHIPPDFARPRTSHAWLTVACVVVGLAAAEHANAVVASGGTYAVDEGVVGASTGGTTSSPTSAVISTSGEAVAGPVTSAGSDARLGYVASIPGVLHLSVDTSGVDLDPPVTGASVSATTAISVRTEATGYSLSLAQDHDMRHTSGSWSIPPVGAPIAAPAAWVEGTTVGLGFTVEGDDMDPKWGTSPAKAYAAVPNAPTVFYAGGPNAGPDELDVEYRLAISMAQTAGDYSSTVSYTAVPTV